MNQTTDFPPAIHTACSVCNPRAQGTFRNDTESFAETASFCTLKKSPTNALLSDSANSSPIFPGIRALVVCLTPEGYATLSPSFMHAVLLLARLAKSPTSHKKHGQKQSGKACIPAKIGAESPKKISAGDSVIYLEGALCTGVNYILREVGL